MNLGDDDLNDLLILRLGPAFPGASLFQGHGRAARMPALDDRDLVDAGPGRPSISSRGAGRTETATASPETCDVQR
jgi:hypothetical protein